MEPRGEKSILQRLVKCGNFSRAFCAACTSLARAARIYGVHTHNMRAHGVKQKPSVRARALPIMNMYGSFCGRYARVLFAPARLVCACEIKGCRPPVLPSSPSVAHTRAFSRPPFAFTPPRRPFTRSYVLSFPLLLFISAYADYATVFSRTPPASSALSLRPRRRRRATFISGCDDNLVPRANKC